MDFQYQSSTEYEVREGIIDLYLNVKIRSSDEVSYVQAIQAWIQIANFSDELMEEERERLFKVDSIEVLEYIKQSVEILMNMKGDEYDQYIKNREYQEKQREKEDKKRVLA